MPIKWEYHILISKTTYRLTKELKWKKAKEKVPFYQITKAKAILPLWKTSVI